MGYRVIADKNQTDIMRATYGKRQGLEGPFLYPNGRVAYYDPKEGKYYDPRTDFYLEEDEANELTMSVFNLIKNT